MKVLLVNPHETDQSGFTSMPLGLLYLAGMLLKHSVEVHVIDGCLLGKTAVLDAITHHKPDFVGITALSTGRKRALEIAREAKGIVPSAMVILGGAHPSIMYEQILTHYKDVDVVVIGEGEETLVEIVKGKPLAEINGIAFRTEIGEIRKTPLRQLVQNLDEIPFPPWHLVDPCKYQPWGKGIKNGINLRTAIRIPVVFSRGCKGHCDFCSSWWLWRGWRHRSPGNMADELELLYRQYGFRHFSFVDDAMTVNRQATIELCDEIISRGLKIAFNVTTRTDCVDEAVLNKLRNAGCYEIAYGVETGSQTMLQSITKENSIQTAELAIRLTKEAGIHVNALMMTGNPGETPETIEETLNFLKRTKPQQVSAGIGIWLLPGTKIYRQCKRKGIINDDFWLTDEPYLVYTEEYSFEEITKMHNRLRTYSLRSRFGHLVEYLTKKKKEYEKMFNRQQSRRKNP